MDIYKEIDGELTLLDDAEKIKRKDTIEGEYFRQIDGKTVIHSEEEKAAIIALRTPNKEKIKLMAKKLYNEIEEHFFIEANGRVYNFDISKKIDFFAKFVMMPDDGVLLWTAHDNVEYPHTKQEALNVFISAEAFLKPLFDAKKLDKEGDGSLSNLKAIEAAQEALRS